MHLSNVLSNAVEYIEKHINRKMTIEDMAKELFISPAHLQRLFKMATGQSLMGYVRGRKLAQSLERLHDKDIRIIDLSQEFGFKHEQSYIHAFYEEYGCTPGKARKNKVSLPIREKLSFINVSEVGTLHGPELVIAPRQYIVGKSYFFENFTFERDALTPNQMALQFVRDSVPKIVNISKPPVYIGFGINHSEHDLEYMPGVAVENLEQIPDGLTGKTILSCLCARFIYVGEHSFEDINMIAAGTMYEEMHKFWSKQTRYTRADNTFYERVNPILIDGKYCRMERYLPIIDHTSEK